MINLERQSTLARLLAKENVSVQHGNYQTAFFDVEKRVLGLPMWKDKGKDVYDLLVGHEVGHALYTPAEGWHDSDKEIPGVPRSYINVIEDIRIEKAIQRTYPGLVASFKRGYKVLDDDDFFGLSNRNVNSLTLIDRINVKSKLRDLVEVNFSDKELPLIDMAFSVETWEDVLAACKAIYEYVKEEVQNDKTETNPEQSVSKNSESDEQSVGDDSTSDEQSNNESRDEASEPSSAASREESDSSENDEDPVESQNIDVKSAGDLDPDQVLTDNAFRSNEEKLLDMDDNGTQRKYVKAITRSQLNEAINTYKEIFDARDEFLKERDDHVPMYDDKEKVDVDSAYSEFVASTKKYVNVMSKEFEMRKMAYRYSRAQTARSGALDVNNLYSYKYNDDIFKKVTTLADAKSHGMVMLIDYSGSMHGVIDDVIKQTLILVSFCKKVNIPFEVYSFTSGHYSADAEIPVNGLDHGGLKINQLLTSKMSKSDFTRGYKDLFAQTLHRYRHYSYDGSSKLEGFGGTPLNETLMGMRFILADFQKQYGVQKVNAVILTDGDAQSVYHRYDNEAQIRTRGVAIDVDGKIIKPRHDKDLTTQLMKMLSDKYTTIGYFLAERPYDMRGKIWQIEDGWVPENKMSDLRKAYNKKGFLEFDQTIGYDKFFVVKSDKKNLNTEDDEFDVSADATKAQIRNAFKKHAASKKANKLFATSFARMVA